MSFWHEPDYDGIQTISWTCDVPSITDEQFWAAWEKLSGDDVASLERDLMRMGRPAVV